MHRLQSGKAAEARFFQGFCEEGHYGGRTRPTNTRQGIYAVSASGDFLASVNTTRAEPVLRMLEQAIARYDELSAGRRVVSEEMKAALERSPRLEDRFPEDGLVLRVASKDLDGTRADRSWHKTARNFDWAWFRKAEVRGFLPAPLERGSRSRVDENLVSRIVRCHLLDNVRGQTSAFRKSEVRRAELDVVVESRTETAVTLRFEGATRAQRDDEPWPRGFVTKLSGRAMWDPKGERFTKFELLATGKRWGHTRFNSRQPRRRGRSEGEASPSGATESSAEPIAVFLELVPRAATRRVAPAHIWQYGW